VALTKRIYLIDCPGVVNANEGKDEVEVVLKGCVRAEKLEDPSFYIPQLLTKIKPEIMQRIYKIEKFEDDEDFLK
jgi:nuclear GTP-binding protein